LGLVLGTKKQSSEQRKAPQTDRRTYSPPKLREFGPVGALTQAGTGAATEMVMGNNSMKMA
jgi:hypothetical protein